MGSGGVVDLDEVWRMLEHCAPGFRRSESMHYWCVTFGDKTYPTLPLGPHGRRHNPSVQTGHVRKMARHLGILSCAKAFIEGL